MPLKAGPNGTMRHYSSSTGRYISEFDWQMANKPPLTKSEKKHLREINLKKELDEKALKSKDPYLNEVYHYLQKNMPYCVTNINETVFIPDAQRGHEIDIICKNGIIEIKSSAHPHCLSQVLIQKQFATKRKLKHILFAPNINARAQKVYEDKDVIVAKHLHEIIKELKK